MWHRVDSHRRENLKSYKLEIHYYTPRVRSKQLGKDFLV
jgi:hypothetical protein